MFSLCMPHVYQRARHNRSFGAVCVLEWTENTVIQVQDYKTEAHGGGREEQVSCAPAGIDPPLLPPEHRSATVSLHTP